jgi:hypothetical protein
MMSLGRIETLAMLAGCLMVGLLGCSCSTMKPLYYSAVIANEGQEWIRVVPFKLANAPHSTVRVGEVHPGGRAGMSSFSCKPDGTFSIAWRLVKTGEAKQAQAVVELPKEFTKELGSAIVFHIKPEEGTVAVTYEIIDPRTGRISVIRPSGDASK